MQDLLDSKWMFIKGVIFVGIGLTSGGLLIASNTSLETVILLLLAVWSFCRAYYFAFYVIERYIDPTFKFSGLFSALKYIVQRGRKRVGKIKGV